MLKMVDGTGIIGVDMICPLGISTPQPPNYDKVEVEGTGILVLPNSLDAPLERLELIGNSTQGENPAPDNPQEIKSAGRFDEASGKYLLDVKITGKNLLNLQKEPDVKGIYQGWYVGNHGKSTLSIKDKGNNSDISGCYIGVNTDGITGNSVSWIVENGVIKNNKLLATTRPYVCVYPANDTVIKKLTDRFEIQYEYGSIATEYQPYKEQLLTLTSDRPLTKWDRLVEQGGEIGWLYGSVIATIDETADISLYAPNGFFIHVKNIDKKEKSGYCDKLYTKKMSNGEPFVLFGIANNNFLYTLNTQEFYGKIASEIKAKLKDTHSILSENQKPPNSSPFHNPSRTQSEH